VALVLLMESVLRRYSIAHAERLRAVTSISICMRGSTIRGRSMCGEGEPCEVFPRRIGQQSGKRAASGST